MASERWLEVKDKRGRKPLLRASRIIEIRSNPRGCELLYRRGESFVSWEASMQLTNDFATLKSELCDLIEGDA